MFCSRLFFGVLAGSWVWRLYQTKGLEWTIDVVVSGVLIGWLMAGPLLFKGHQCCQSLKSDKDR